MTMTLLFAGRLFAALLLGAVVGLERQWRSAWQVQGPMPLLPQLS